MISLNKMVIALIFFAVILSCNTGKKNIYANNIQLSTDTLKMSSPILNYKYPISTFFIDSLRLIYGRNKVFPDSMTPQILIALTHYPELINEKIIFKVNKTKVAHSSRPKISSMLNPFKKRFYVIRISSEVEESLNTTLHWNLHFNSKIGVIGHELAHTLYYHDRGFWGILKDGISYSCSKKFRIQFERETDRRAIDHNLGHQLYQWSCSVHKTLELHGRGRHYLNPIEITDIINQNPFYSKN